MTKEYFPPSLSKVSEAGGPDETEDERQRRDHRNARLEREVAREKATQSTRAAVEGAMRKLPLRPDAENLIPGMIGLFEQAHHAAINQVANKPATARTMEI